MVFAGVVMQNCASDCKTGVQVVSRPGEPVRTKVSDAPPDADGVLEFCATREALCATNVRVLRVNESESLGPAFARYLASKLWFGEELFVQVDAHMWFTDHWDDVLRAALKATPSWPKTVLSAYPPGPGANWKQSTGSRLCRCSFSTSPAEAHIIRLGSGGGSRTKPGDAQPMRSAYVAAGFFAAHASFLEHVPFDPYLPFVFMGEEIHLTARFWTNGFDVYAPRRPIVAHQYRPGKLGLPKFWESTARTFGARGGFNTDLSLMIVDRVKHVVGYPEVADNATAKWPQVLQHLNDQTGPNYGLGNQRTLADFLHQANIDMVQKQTGDALWCNERR